MTRLPADESDAYFAGRPRGSQLGAWTSAQSEVLESREQFDAEYAATEARFEGQHRSPVRRSGAASASLADRVLVRPHVTLHDRILYVREGASWKFRSSEFDRRLRASKSLYVRSQTRRAT